MTRRVLSDAERIASIREVIKAARGDWHEATALYSVGADLNWLLDIAALRVEPSSIDVERLAQVEADRDRMLVAVKAAILNIQHNRIGAAIAGLRIARDLSDAARLTQEATRAERTRE